MNLEKVWDGRWAAPSKSALSGNIVFLNVSVRCFHSPPATLYAVRIMNDSKYQAGLSRQI